ncbi:hypothetical protein IAG44_20460 [Streptomyces roseirectus]|uniref:Uncharacterized protein n=1 Tax=Streptomyces roseirectus TaxID=2768066 RepID=A0A7H0IFK0_9ACTN|nr:hypothetical protein [Streptomyces roseirectus]QNP71566.1 hypothetical protein IAG44_20460 [Streptomyces roseirectus]
MSDVNPAPHARPPRWMPIGEESELCSVGVWWDVVRAEEAVGSRAIEILRARNEPLGPVIMDFGGAEPRLYFLVPVGTASTWSEPGTVALGQNCHVVVPPADTTKPPGMHWYVPASGPRTLTLPPALRRALIQARGEQRGTAEETAP